MGLIRFERLVKVGVTVDNRFAGRFAAKRSDELPKTVERARRIGAAYGNGAETLLFTLERRIVFPFIGPITYRSEELGKDDVGFKKAQNVFSG